MVRVNSYVDNLTLTISCNLLLDGPHLLDGYIMWTEIRKAGTTGSETMFLLKNWLDFICIYIADEFLTWCHHKSGGGAV